MLTNTSPTAATTTSSTAATACRVSGQSGPEHAEEQHVTCPYACSIVASICSQSAKRTTIHRRATTAITIAHQAERKSYPDRLPISASTLAISTHTGQRPYATVSTARHNQPCQYPSPDSRDYSCRAMRGLSTANTAAPERHTSDDVRA
jgi:hypothetical protein